MKQKHCSFLFFLFLVNLTFSSYLLFSQPILGWQKTIGTEESDMPVSLCATRDGGFVMGINIKNVTEIEGRKHLNWDFKLIKFSKTGNLDWERSFSAPLRDNLVSIIETTDGFAILAVSRSSSGDIKYNYGGSDVLVIKLGPLGDVRWSKNYGGSGEDYGSEIIELEDRNLLVVGSTNSFDHDVRTNFGNKDFWLFKIDHFGNLISSAAFGGEKDDWAADVVKSTEGAFVITGRTRSDDDERFHAGGIDACVLKVNLQGEIFWFKNYGGSRNDFGIEIEKTETGGYLILGSTDSMDGDVKCNLGFRDIWMIKVKSNGTMEENWCLGGGEYETPHSMKKTNDDGFVIAAQSKSFDGDLDANEGDYDAWVIKLNVKQEIDWKINLGGYQKDAAKDVHQTPEGDYIVLAETNSKEMLDLFGGSDSWVFQILDPNAKKIEIVKPTGFKLDLKSSHIKFDFFRLGIETAKKGHCVIEILNESGTNFLYDTKSLNEGSNSFTFFIDSVPNGEYKLKVTMDGDVAVVPISIDY